MKSISRLSALFVLLVLASCSGEINDLERRGLKGKVKATNEFHCAATYVNKKWVASEECANVYRVVEYDEEGNYIQAISISDSGDTTNLATVKRENGELVEENYYTRVFMTPKHSNMVLVSRTIMDRVSEDQVNFEVWQNESLTYEGTTYYDSRGRIERQVQVVDNREVIVHHVYEKNLLVEMYQQELDGSRSATQQYEYSEFDDHGNWTLRLVFTGVEKLTPEMAITRVLDYY